MYKPKNSIFHYCRLSTALEYILPYQQLRLSPLINTNDPRENKSYVFASSYWGTNFEKVKKSDSEISQTLREDCKVLCFSQNHEGFDGSEGLKFFGHELSRMWAYYSDNHKGVCLELDKEEFIRENEGIIKSDLFRDVQYFGFDFKARGHKVIDFTIAENIGLEKYLRGTFRSEHADYLFFTKNKEWESEHEIRLVHFSEKKENEFCSIKSSLRNIYCGVDFNKSYLPSLIHLCPEIDVSIMEYRDVRLISRVIFSKKENFVDAEYSNLKSLFHI